MITIKLYKLSKNIYKIFEKYNLFSGILYITENLINKYFQFFIESLLVFLIFYPEYSF